ncbi:sphingomyelin phosphodiesterase 2-like isoform X2 [Convolutriloba macropyga]|uniref:sphingomyelin phosphodiesterase 2-like isoform X2 n=1 Tax=Convolutriloba macropyga TaxID=536237 RepID=UPI003F523B70
MDTLNQVSNLKHRTMTNHTMVDRDYKLKILTLNCFLLPPVPIMNYIPGVPDQQKPEETMRRIRDICNNILMNDYDIVCLQEIWMRNHKDAIMSQLQSKYPQHAWFPSGFLPGSGLLTMSKFKMVSSFFHRFVLEDKMFPFGSLDSICGKGCGVSLLEVDGFIVTLINTHPQSEQDSTDSKDAVRLHQLWEIGQLARHFWTLSDLVVVCGDLNATPDFLGIKALSAMAHMQDTFLTSETKSKRTSTYACKDNCLVEPEYLKYFPSGARIDYILYCSGIRSIFSSLSRQSCDSITCDHTRVRPWGRLGEESKMPFSDHEAVDTQLTWSTKWSKNSKGDASPPTLEERYSSSSDLLTDNTHLPSLSQTQKYFARRARVSMSRKQMHLAISVCFGVTLVTLFLFNLVLCSDVIQFEHPMIVMSCLSLFQIVCGAVFGTSFYHFYYYKCANSAYLQASLSLNQICSDAYLKR